jgi:hypothetical protein
MDEVERLRRRVAEVEALVEKLTRTVEQQAKTIEKLTAALDEARRAGKRQAAPFRQGPPKSEPKRPGRKPGDQYGQQFRRAVPSDDEIDETYDVPLPPVCPQCGSRHLDETHVATQYQIELPAKPIQRRFDVHVGCCGECGQRVQGRHELQTSDALGAASVQLGANAHAAMAWLNKSLGIPHGKIATPRELRLQPDAHAEVGRGQQRFPQVLVTQAAFEPGPVMLLVQLQRGVQQLDRIAIVGSRSLPSVSSCQQIKVPRGSRRNPHAPLPSLFGIGSVVTSDVLKPHRACLGGSLASALRQDTENNRVVQKPENHRDKLGGAFQNAMRHGTVLVNGVEVKAASKP